MDTSSILFISLMNGAAWGGSEELWYKTALYLAQKGGKVGCVLYEWQEKQERIQRLEDAGCKIYLLPGRRKTKQNFIRRLLHKQQYKAQLRKAMEALPVKEYATVVINQGGYEVYTPAWKNFYRRLNHYALMFHNYNELQQFSLPQKKALGSWIQHASLNLFAAQKAREVLQKQLTADIPRAEVFINPISFPPPEAATPFPVLLHGNYIFSVFAALDTNRKAQDALIKTLSAQKWKERNWQLHLFGEGRDRDYLQSLINELRLQEKVFLKGHTSNVVKALQATHLVLQITRIDAMPLSVVEAMAMSRPLVVSPVGDMPLWVEDGVNGWICNSSSPAIDVCLEKAWQKKEQWPEMGKKSFERFRQKFPQQVEEAFLQTLAAEKR